MMYFVLGFVLGISLIILLIRAGWEWFKKKGFTEDDDLYEDSISVEPAELFLMKDLQTNDRYIAYCDEDTTIHAYCAKTKTHLTIFKEGDRDMYVYKRISIGSKRFFEWLFSIIGKEI